MNLLEPAQIKDIGICYDIVDDGRRFQREQGFVQWTDDYPNVDIIRRDIESGKGYILKADGETAGYLCIDYEGEPAYRHIQGKWRTEEPYAVVHRMAIGSKFRGMGLASTGFRLIEELCIQNNIWDIRVDTDFPNKRMQYILTKNGFVNRGVIILRGSGRLAFDKSLKKFSI